MSSAHYTSSSSLAAGQRLAQRDDAEEQLLNTLVDLGLTSRKNVTVKPPKKRGVSFETDLHGTGSNPDPPSLKGTKLLKTYLSERGTYSSTTSPSRSRPKTARSSSSGRGFDDELNTMIDATGPRSRRERTFIGSACAACEEPLEHTLRGERILQLSCGHVSHEACFYEYIKEFESQDCPTCNAPLGLDTSRGGNLDFEKLNSLVRSVQTPDLRDRSDHLKTPIPWDTETVRNDAQSVHSQRPVQAEQRHYSTPAQARGGSNRGSDKYSAEYRQHARNDSGATNAPSSTDYADPQHTNARRHDYDVQSMETSVTNSRTHAKNPIPAPIVTVRSEFPTLSRSRQQQSLTCIVTVEVVDGKWRADPQDIRSPASLTAPVPNLFDNYAHMKSADHLRQPDIPRGPPEVLERVTEELHNKVDNWHGLDFARFGKLLLHGTIRVGKDRQSWQDLECFLFTDMLICVKEKKLPQQQQWNGSDSGPQKSNKCTLKGSILIKKHLKQVQIPPGRQQYMAGWRALLTSLEQHTLTLNLSVAELPHFHLQFHERTEMEVWRRALLNLNRVELPDREYDIDNSGTDDDDYTTTSKAGRRVSSMHSSSYGGGGPRSNYTAPTEYTNSRVGVPDARLQPSVHVPLDIVVVIPVSSSMQGLKISLLRDVLRFLVSNLGERDRMGLVTFGSSGGGMPIVGMTSKTWLGWSKVLDSIRPVGQKSLRGDVVEGANVAMDLLMQRRSSNPLSSIILISDSSTSDAESVDFVVSRAEAAKIAIHSFGLGLTHKPDTMIELSTRTKATYTYVKDWMMLRECVAGCLGSLQSISHQNVKLKLRLPEGSPAKFVKINGALQITKRATGRDAEASLGDLRFGDKRDILIQLAIAPDAATPEQVPQDPWETMVSGLEALGGPLEQDDIARTISVEEVPLIQADLTWGDIIREGNLSQLPRPSLLAITMLPGASRKSMMTQNANTPPIPPHPSVVQRRMELLTSDMLMRALTLVSRGQHERACHLLTETRSILKGLGKGSLPPLPPSGPPPTSRLPPTPTLSGSGSADHSPDLSHVPTPSEARRTPSPPRLEPHSPFTPAAGVDPATMTALDAELEASLEWINHPAVFGRDSRKAVLQAIGVISSQRAFTFRTPAEGLWAGRIPGVRRLSEKSRDWRESGDEVVMEEV